jgi:hypothetical protein
MECCLGMLRLIGQRTTIIFSTISEPPNTSQRVTPPSSTLVEAGALRRIADHVNGSGRVERRTSANIRKDWNSAGVESALD